MTRVLVEGDSYGLPRINKFSGSVALNYEQTYPYRLQAHLEQQTGEKVLMVNRCRHANTTWSLVPYEIDELRFLRPNLVVIELGLTDLWPAKGRKFSPLYPELSGKDPWVSEDEFRYKLSYFTQEAVERGSKVQVVGIPAVAQTQLDKYPEVYSRIIAYNRILQSLEDDEGKIKYLDWYRDVVENMGSKSMIGEDGIHPTFEASEMLAQRIVKKFLV